MSFWELVIEQWQQQSVVEIFAFLLAIAYVWFAAEESIWCWPAAFLSTGLYVYVYWDVTLIFQMLLNVYYVAMAIWGYITWRKVGEEKIIVTRMSWRMHILTIICGVFATSIIYFIAIKWFSYDTVLFDITLAIFSLLATFMTVSKCLESWYYWSIINFVSIFLFLESNLYLTVVLMLIYLVLAVRGLYHWNQVYQDNLFHLKDH